MLYVYWTLQRFDNLVCLHFHARSAFHAICAVAKKEKWDRQEKSSRPIEEREMWIPKRRISCYIVKKRRKGRRELRRHIYNRRLYSLRTYIYGKFDLTGLVITQYRLGHARVQCRESWIFFCFPLGLFPIYFLLSFLYMCVGTFLLYSPPSMCFLPYPFKTNLCSQSGTRSARKLNVMLTIDKQQCFHRTSRFFFFLWRKMPFYYPFFIFELLNCTCIR